MGKIAAMILPTRRSGELDQLSDEMGDLLRHSSKHSIDKHTYTGTETVCALLRVKPDKLNPLPQPVQAGKCAGVSCGYYVANDTRAPDPANESCGIPIADSALRLITDVAYAGEQKLPFNDGVYAFALWDGDKIIAGVDKLGMRPLFWTAVKGGGYAVASEAKALVPFIEEPLVNWHAWEEYFYFGYLLGSHTQFKGVYRLGAAEVMRCRVHKHSIRPAENFLENIEIVDRSTNDFLDEQHEVFGRAMDRLTHLFDSEHDAMLTLSGGFDSRRIMAWLLEKRLNFDAYTVPDIKPDGFEYESSIVRDLCLKYGINGYNVYPDSIQERQKITTVRDLLTDFESDEHRIPAILAMAMDGYPKVNFDGIGGDILVEGLFLKPYFFQPGGQERFIASWPVTPRKKWLMLPALTPTLEARTSNFFKQWGDNPNRFTYFYLMSRTRREVALAPLSMLANSVESLCPYFDREFMRSALSFPPSKKVDTQLQRALIRKYDTALAAFATSHDPGVEQDQRYVQATKGIQRKAQIRNLKEVSRHLSGHRAWGPTRVQKWRFLLISLLHQFLSDELVEWEIGKAEKTAALIHFMRANGCKEKYLEDVLKLQDAFDSQKSWIKAMS